MKDKKPTTSQLIKALIALLLHITIVVAAEEAYDDTSRHPYAYNYTVVDSDTNNNYEVSLFSRIVQT